MQLSVSGQVIGGNLKPVRRTMQIFALNQDAARYHSFAGIRWQFIIPWRDTKGGTTDINGQNHAAAPRVLHPSKDQARLLSTGAEDTESSRLTLFYKLGHGRDRVNHQNIPDATIVDNSRTLLHMSSAVLALNHSELA